MGLRGSKLTLQEQFRLTKRQINKSIRELERENNKLHIEEKSLKSELKKAAQQGNMTQIKILAKDLARIRKSSNKFSQMRSQLQSVNCKLQTVKSTNAMATSMKEIPKLMVIMNKQLDVPKLQAIMKSFLVESEKLGFTQDMLDDVVEGVVDNGYEDDEVQENIVQQVLEEVGIDLSDQLLQAPPTKTATPAKQVISDQTAVSPEAAEAHALENSIEERLKKLNL